MSQTRQDPLFASRKMRRRFGSTHAAAVAGIICATGWSVSLAGLLSAPGIGASDADIDRYYSDPANGTAAMIWVEQPGAAHPLRTAIWRLASGERQPT